MKTFFFNIFIFIALGALAQKSQTKFNIQWKFRKVGSEKFYPAQVPGTVHTDLLQNKLIEDPFLNTNESKIQWIENEDWEYQGTFKCDKQTLQNKHVELLFEGLDTYAKVYLNGKEVLSANSMFRSWSIDAKSQLKVGNNSIKIIFESAVKRGKAEAAKLPYTLPGDEKVFTRKAQYQYGWDWGPRLVTCGIYKPVQLIYWNDVKLETVKHIIKSINDTIAEVQFITRIISHDGGNYNFMINAYHGNISNAKLQPMRNYDLKLKKGINVDTLTYTIDHPKLWNTNGLGEAHLYGCDFEIRKGSAVLAVKKINIGLRKLELVKEKDLFGESFYFKLNGKPVFMKGANYIPQDNFVSRTKRDEYDKLIIMAKEANMNMLRVWGGGVYPDDDFYDLCDRNGILVWQDFMFACAMYPGDSAFVRNVEQEVKEQTERLQNHPSIALWCGNNENDEGWHNWGWQKQYKYSKQDSTTIWNDYTKLFHQVIPKAIKTTDIAYHSSSPSIGWGHPESLVQGDSHYWGIWWGMEPFDVYEKKVGRFMSEYGFQGMPEMNTLKKVCDTLSMSSQSVKAHQKHPTGYQTIQTYMERDYKVPTDFVKYNYVSQLLQRDGMKIAIEAHRRAMPYCMGTLYWQLNDCWPVTSWSAIDYYHKPKALYYHTQHLYNDILISVKESRNQYDVYIISDRLEDFVGELNVSLKNTKGEVLMTQSKYLTIKNNSSNLYVTLNEEVIKQFSKSENYLSVELKTKDGKSSYSTNYFFVKPKELKLYEPGLKMELSEDGKALYVSSNKFVKDLYLYSINSTIHFEDNFLDLEPGRVTVIKLEAGIKFLNEIKHISLYDVNN